jgi:hypothetical protein
MSRYGSQDESDAEYDRIQREADQVYRETVISAARGGHPQGHDGSAAVIRREAAEAERIERVQREQAELAKQARKRAEILDESERARAERHLRIATSDVPDAVSLRPATDEEYIRHSRGGTT